MSATFKIGTRGSPLALAQAQVVATPLREQGVEVEIVRVRTEGDRLLEVPLAEVGGKGLFVREIEQMLLAGALDCAVHSLKDLPADLPTGLTLAAFPEREDPRDVLVARARTRFEDLRPGAVLGTSSPRRRALALALRPDLVVEPIRGNVDTRLRKLEGGTFDGVLLAAAGLARLGLIAPHAQPLDPEVFVPAVGQGVLAIETRTGDRRAGALLERLDHAATRACALAERACLRRLGASCNSPMAAHAVIAADTLRITALVASEDGRKVLRGSAAASPAAPEAVGRRLADSLLEQGAASVTALRPVTQWPA
ncbi:MAG: hydroxymethylbilane synthase [Candidatus Rokuibacteriota bacterium]|nr:MAG: hydroxymethylbilane synthase [Candidatus Rokubacteria bacterium]